MASLSAAAVSALATGASHLFVAKHYALACVSLSFYEIAITFDREWETVWKRKKSFVTVLWVLNRYLPSVLHIPTQVAMLHPIPHDVSSALYSLYMLMSTGLRFVYFPGAIQIISNLAIGMTLILRTYALYHQNPWILVILFPPYLASFSVESWAVAGGAPVPLKNGFTGCILTGRPQQGLRIAALWMGQLVFPTIIFALTLARVIRLRRVGPEGANSIASLMLRDGTMYFFVIFSINVLNVVTYSLAPTDLKAVNATFSSIMQGIMICRLMLNLRGGMNEPVVHSGLKIAYAGTELSNHASTFVGNLGADMDVYNDGGFESLPRLPSREWRRFSYGRRTVDESFLENDQATLSRMRNIVVRS